MVRRVKHMGIKIKKHRKSCELSQWELACLSGLSVSTVAKLETGVVNNPTIKTISAIASVLNVKIGNN
jgi:transcriptional regulator with XRE-family HTH domain